MKQVVKTKNKDAATLAQLFQQDWLRSCNAARIKEHLSQNDMDMILDAKFRWDRKQFGKSFKPRI